MAAFSTLALIGAGLLGAGAVAKKLSSGSNSAATSRSLAPGPASTTLGRQRPADSPIIGQAIPRVDPNNPAAKITAPTPPAAANTGQAAIGAADAAAQKARRRGGNQSLLTGRGRDQRSADFKPKSLLGY